MKLHHDDESSPPLCYPRSTFNGGYFAKWKISSIIETNFFYINKDETEVWSVTFLVKTILTLLVECEWIPRVFFCKDHKCRGNACFVKRKSLEFSAHNHHRERQCCCCEAAKKFMNGANLLNVLGSEIHSFAVHDSCKCAHDDD